MNDGRPTGIRYLVMGLLCLMAVLGYVCRNAVGVAEETIRESVGMSKTQSGHFMGAFFWSYALLQVPMEVEGGREIAKRSRGTPRVANRLLRRVRDYAQVRAGGTITGSVARDALSRLNVDEFGLDDMDARILTTLIEKFSGGPVGLNTLAVAVGEDSGTLEEVYEPYLIQQGFLERTPRGRCATANAYRRFGITPPPGQATIFDG